MSRVGSEETLARFLHEVVDRVRRRVDEVRGLVAASRVGLEPHEKNTLELGCGVVLGALAFGLQVGGWPAWSLVVAGAGYAAWVLAYSEMTVQANGRHRERRPLVASD